MRKNFIATLFALCFIIIVVNVAGATLVGDTVVSEHLDSGFGPKEAIVTDDATDIMTPFSNWYSVDVGADEITVTFNQLVIWSSNPTGFNGLVVSSLDDSSGNVLSNIVTTSSLAGYNTDWITFSDGQVSFNWNGWEIPSGTTFHVDLEFNSVPLKNPDTKILASIEVEGGEDHYTFTANEGDYIILRTFKTAGDNGFSPYMKLFAPPGELQVDSGNIIYYPAEYSGTYTVALYDSVTPGGGDDTGQYVFYYTHIPGANEIGPLINGGLHQQTIDIGDIDSYIFTANEGDHIELHASKTAGDLTFDPYMKLFAPPGELQVESDADIIHTTEYSGTYTVVIYDSLARGGADDTGNYELTYENEPVYTPSVPAVSWWGLVLASILLVSTIGRKMTQA